MRCETIKIQSNDDYAIINKSDFDKKKHKLFDGTPGAKIKQTPLSEKKSKAKS